MKYIVYLTKNNKSKINGINRIYIGVHATEDPEVFDGYLGNGIIKSQVGTYKYPKTPLQWAVKKYGANSFERITLFVYDNKENAYKKKHELADEHFINSSYTYNVEVGDETKRLYQFNYDGKLVKTWDSFEECADFYGYPINRFYGMVKDKCGFLNSYWSIYPAIDKSNYTVKHISILHLYNIEGKLMREFTSYEECAKFIQCTISDIKYAIKNQTAINSTYYVSNKMTEQFLPKPRKNYMYQTYYVYKGDEFLGEYVGKGLMNAIKLHSWAKISKIFSEYQGHYEDYYIMIGHPKHSISIDVYTNQGEFIEKLNSLDELASKYNIPKAKVKRIQRGERYFGDYVIKYSK